MSVSLEVPIFGPASAHMAVEAGAFRLELNATGSYPRGGLTPKIDDLAQLNSLAIPVRIMIRPRGPPSPPAVDFIYSDEELDTMEQSIQDFKGSGLLVEARGDGFVFGVLEELGTGARTGQTTDGAQELRSGQVVLGVESCKRLVRAAQPYKTVFHRAFDEIVGFGQGDSQLLEWEKTLRVLCCCGFDGVLTSGGPGSAIQNVETLEKIMEKAPDSIEIIVGGGVRGANVGELGRRLKLQERKKAGGSWVHSSCLTAEGSELVDAQEVANIMKQVS
jgi:copper homeostasis protein